MENWIKTSTEWLINYCDTFKSLTEQQQENFNIKKNHSIRVAQNALLISNKLQLSDELNKTAYLTGLLHDIGRFPQLAKYNTFDDKNSVDHAELAIEVLEKDNPFELLNFENIEILLTAILNHNKLTVQDGLDDDKLLHTKIIRDADKLDIYKVLTDYYSNRNGKPNHTLTWNLQKGTKVSKEVASEVMSGYLVSKKNVISEIDVKIMQLSWVYDLNFSQSYEILMKNRYLEVIFNSLSKSDLVIEIYRKVKVFAENRIMS